MQAFFSFLTVPPTVIQIRFFYWTSKELGSWHQPSPLFNIFCCSRGPLTRMFKNLHKQPVVALFENIWLFLGTKNATLVTLVNNQNGSIKWIISDSSIWPEAKSALYPKPLKNCTIVRRRSRWSAHTRWKIGHKKCAKFHSSKNGQLACQKLSLIHIWRCRRSTLCRSRWSPYH